MGITIDLYVIPQAEYAPNLTGEYSIKESYVRDRNEIIA